MNIVVSGATNMYDFLANDVIREDMETIYAASLPWEQLRSQSVLITGSYGMLASYLVYFLCWLNEKQGFNVQIYAQGRSEEKMRSRYGLYMDRPYFHPCYFSVTEPVKLDQDMDYIIHAASGTYPTSYSTNPVEIAEPNALGTYYLLKYALAHNCKGFEYFSTGDIYGKVIKTADISEDDSGSLNPLDLHSCYGESKRMGETWCSLFSKEYAVPTRIVRIGHTYGPTMDIENDPRVFASFIKNVVSGEDIHLHSDGTAKRPFCYIADACVAFLLILLKGKNGEAYNMANTGQFLSMNELAEILVGLVPEDGLNVVHDQNVANTGYLENKANKQNSLSSQKLMKLGWEPKIGVREGFGRVLSVKNEPR